MSKSLLNLESLSVLPSLRAVVLGGAQPQANMWGQQQVAGPAPQVPASGQSMGQAVADISAGLRLMQQSPGGSLPPWPLPPVGSPAYPECTCVTLILGAYAYKNSSHPSTNCSEDVQLFGHVFPCKCVTLYCC